MRAYRGVALHKTIIAALTTGRTFRGVLFETRGELIVLKNAELIDDERIIPVDGTVVIDRAKIEFIQVVN